MSSPSIYTSLEDARSAVRDRWQNTALKSHVEKELGQYLWLQLSKSPRGVYWRCFSSPENGFTFFLQSSHWLGLYPFMPEYIEDKFVSINEEKQGLGRLRIIMPDGAKATADIVNWRNSEGKPISQVFLLTGERLVQFHHRLFHFAAYPVERSDMSPWFISLKPAVRYYYYVLSHFVTHGVLFETFVDEEDARENQFTHEVVYPSIEQIERTFGVRPLIVRLYPPNQTPEEDFYWWSYPPHVNAYLVKWIQENGIPTKPWRAKQK
jgi:hypothetical protein